MTAVLLVSSLLFLGGLCCIVPGIRIVRRGQVQLTTSRLLQGPAARACSLVWFGVSAILISASFVGFNAALAAYRSGEWAT